MKIWQKILVVVVCSGIVGGLSYSGSVWPDYALVLSSFSAGFSALLGVIVGWTPSV